MLSLSHEKARRQATDATDRSGDSNPCEPSNEIDRVLGKHYGFTDEELDFIINYDIKYRMGKGSGEGDDE